MKRCMLLIILMAFAAQVVSPVEPPVIKLQVQAARLGLPIALNFDIGGATNLLLEHSEDLSEWHSSFNIFSKVRFFRWLDRSTVKPAEPRRFYRALSPAQSIQEMLTTWRSLGFAGYRYRFQRTCFCNPTILSGIVTVSNANVVAVTEARAGGTVPIPNPDLSEFKSIEELFELIETEITKADVLAVGFDESLHFPSRIEIDYSTLGVDDEIRYEASDIQPVQ